MSYEEEISKAVEGALEELLGKKHLYQWVRVSFDIRRFGNSRPLRRRKWKSGGVQVKSFAY